MSGYQINVCRPKPKWLDDVKSPGWLQPDWSTEISRKIMLVSTTWVL